jgi:hypothetical protein
MSLRQTIRALQPTPNFTISSRNESDIVSTPYLLMWYTEPPGHAYLPLTLDTLTIRPNRMKNTK